MVRQDGHRKGEKTYAEYGNQRRSADLRRQLRAPVLKELQAQVALAFQDRSNLSSTLDLGLCLSSLVCLAFHHAQTSGIKDEKKSLTTQPAERSPRPARQVVYIYIYLQLFAYVYTLPVPYEVLCSTVS